VPITSAAITSLIDTNEKRGLLRRMAYPDDRRKVQVLITREGRDLIDRLLPGTHRLEREVMGVLSDGEKATLLGLLEKIDRSVGAIEDEPPVLAEAPRHRPDRLDYEPEP
jgi:MarR family 2-MHQ and catechol resistance regulon transcriptional repressor